MSDSIDFSISDKTFSKILTSKQKSGFNDKSWDDWFNFLLNSEKSIPQKQLLERTANNFYEKSFEDWVTNFALNLPKIWVDESAHALIPNKSEINSSAIIIGKGPSLKKFDHLKLLSESNYQGSIICSDGILIDVLKSGITPEKFPNFYVVTIDPVEKIKFYYEHDLIKKFGNKITGIFSTLTHPQVIEAARKNHLKIHWLHTLFDYFESKKSFNRVSGLMVRAIKHKNGLPGIQTGGNVGTAAWFVGWQILKCKNICLIGIDHGWDEKDSWDLITSHGFNAKSQKIERNSEIAKKLFPTIFNPDFNTYCIMDPIFQYYSNAFKEFISRAPDWVNTINSTQGGSIFGKNITSMNFSNFLSLKI
jgi:hypothetical protein